MANKTGMAFDPEQVQELSSALKAVANVSKTALESAAGCFNQIKGDEVIGDSEQKEPIVAAIVDTEKTFVEVTNKIDRMVSVVDSVCEKLGISTNTNIRTTEEASGALHSQAQKVREASASGGAKA